LLAHCCCDGAREATRIFIIRYPALAFGVRVPYADKTHIKVPANGLSDEQVLFLGDIFPTGWQAAVQCDIQPTDTVAIWGCGPVGQMTIRRWINKAKAQLQAEPVCAMCLVHGRVTAATVADHVTPHRGDARLFWEGTLQSLCRVCRATFEDCTNGS
jgi:threonine dehydrogenase-like Zn-dependent dehydrogenase